MASVRAAFPVNDMLIYAPSVLVLAADRQGARLLSSIAFPRMECGFLRRIFKRGGVISRCLISDQLSDDGHPEQGDLSRPSASCMTTWSSLDLGPAGYYGLGC